MVPPYRDWEQTKCDVVFSCATWLGFAMWKLLAVFPHHRILFDDTYPHAGIPWDSINSQCGNQHSVRQLNSCDLNFYDNFTGGCRRFSDSGAAVSISAADKKGIVANSMINGCFLNLQINIKEIFFFRTRVLILVSRHFHCWRLEISSIFYPKLSHDETSSCCFQSLLLIWISNNGQKFYRQFGF